MNQEDLNKLETWKLIQAQSSKADEEVARRWQQEKRVNVGYTRVAIEYFKTFNIAELLGIETPRRFIDLFDDTKTASIWKKEDSSVYLYKTNGTRAAVDLVGVVGELRGLGFSGTMAYLSEMFNVDYDELSPRIKETNKGIEDFHQHILSVDLKNTMPNTHKLLKDGRTQYGRDIADILTIFKNTIIEVDGQPRMISALSTRELSTRIYGSNKSYNKIQRVLRIMAMLGMVDKLDSNEIPVDILESLINFQQKKKFNKRTDAYEVKQLSFDFFKDVEGKAGVIRDKGITSSCLTRDGLINSFDKAYADKIFIQDRNRVVETITTEMLHEALAYIYNRIESDGFVEEREVIEHLAKLYGITKAKTKIKQIRTPLIVDYGLERCRLNTALKKSFNATANYRETQAPTIYTTA